MSDSLFGKFTIMDEETRSPYMTRYWLGRLRLHIFHRGDNDPDPHDHPWDFWTLPLTSYVEEVTEKLSFMHELQGIEGEYAVYRQIVRAFRLHHRPATHCHRVLGRATATALGLQHHKTGEISRTFWEMDHLPLTDNRKIVTIVWRGKNGRKWGFLRNREGNWCWTPWKEYVFGGGKLAPCGPTDLSTPHQKGK